MNLVSTTLQMFTPMITSRIASALGVNNSMATMAISAIVPTLLAAFAGKAATPAGASALSSARGAQDPGLLGSLESMLGGSAQTNLASTSKHKARFHQPSSL